MCQVWKCSRLVGLDDVGSVVFLAVRMRRASGVVPCVVVGRAPPVVVGGCGRAGAGEDTLLRGSFERAFGVEGDERGKREWCLRCRLTVHGAWFDGVGISRRDHGAVDERV